MSNSANAVRAALVTAMVTAGLVGAAAAVGAEPPGYAALPVDPNIISDSTAYIGQPPVLDPGGQPGVEQTFAHRDNSRQIVDTVLVAPNPQAAAGALQNMQAELPSLVAAPTTEPVDVGENGSVSTGLSPDGSQSVSVLLFTRGTTATEVQFSGAANDPVPLDLVVLYGQQQDQAIRQQLNQ
ncbi:hypothetical protein BVC93_04565 [Mycobacterium sp. MS1601]|uniref:hypothetical protein n=1 Tax=Mycobacterium sp. MS1601 TaxID=1936029 RepID=UPI0009790B0D|nr:hypothetical protein [Mycobacterium sp. MS1601]AQA01832.1 hypothetical protein BVC93_04565 [Mycobacterium sp. MS1601]